MEERLLRGPFAVVIGRFYGGLLFGRFERYHH